MQELSRIGRSLNRAQTAFEALRSTSDPFQQQEAWEQMLDAWKNSVELMRRYAELRARLDIKERRHNERLADQALNYAWAARNVEAHDPRGSADAHPNGLKINPLDRSRPLMIDHLVIDSYGKVSNLAMRNGVTCIEEGRLELKSVEDRQGKNHIVTHPPSNMSPIEIGARAMEFAASFFDEVHKI